MLAHTLMVDIRVPMARIAFRILDGFLPKSPFAMFLVPHPPQSQHTPIKLLLGGNAIAILIEIKKEIEIRILIEIEENDLLTGIITSTKMKSKIRSFPLHLPTGTMRAQLQLIRFLRE